MVRLGIITAIKNTSRVKDKVIIGSYGDAHWPTLDNLCERTAVVDKIACMAKLSNHVGLFSIDQLTISYFSIKVCGLIIGINCGVGNSE